ncbi:GxGYxYP domain-containing protein [Bacteroides difficilis]|jgi:hypothetical protein|uniref:GxGYxYP domain-containing protein n=1 Tax=Bacteroides difficilis TaxID=2763021 RepID=UPI003AADA5EE
MKNWNTNIVIILLLLISLPLACANSEEKGCKEEDSVETPDTDDSVPLGKVKFFPMSKNVASNVAVINTIRWSEAEKVTAYSLQGLVNREKVCIYILQPGDRTAYNFYKSNGYMPNETIETNIWKVAKQFIQYFDGFVAYDPDDFHQIDLATNISGVENRLMIPIDKIDYVKNSFGTNVDILDLRTLGLNSLVEMHDWYIKNIFPKQNKEVLALGSNVPHHNVYRDYAIAFKIPVFWLPGKADADYDANYEKKLFKMLENTPTNIPVLGFWPSTYNGKTYGYSEYQGVGMAGQYGKFTVVNDFFGNYSFHSGLKPWSDKYEQTKVRKKKMHTYDPQKKYVALIMIESGDAIGYMQGLFWERQWDQEHRGDVPVSYGINPSMQYLLPAQLRYLYDTATENNFFFCSISGAGYCYPFEGYGSRTCNPQKTIDSYFKQTENNMKQMDLDMLGLYTHPAKFLDNKDRNLLNHIAKVAPSIKSFILGMHHVKGFDANNSHAMINQNASWHYTITNLLHLEEELPVTEWDNRNYDKKAVDYLIGEIKKASTNGQFIQAMFYSWTYGPRRLYAVKEQLEKEGYVFVTLNEFDYLYRLWKTDN